MRFQRGSSMAKQRDVAFRSAMSGYNRKDVNAYIIDINRKFEEQEAELRTQITAAEDRAAQSESAAQSVREEAAAAVQAKEEADVTFFLEECNRVVKLTWERSSRAKP